MSQRSLTDWLAAKPAAIRGSGPVAIILCEDDAAIAETLDHHLGIGFRHILALSAEPLDPRLPVLRDARVTNLIHDCRRADAHVEAVNAVIAAAAPGLWLYYAYNAEFLFFPFSESRSVGEMLAFHTEERRAAMLCYAIDLYARDLTVAPDAVDIDGAMFDPRLHFALSPDGTERRLDFHGGLRWRFEDLLPADRRRIDRIALFRTEHGLRLQADHRLNRAEMNTYSCAWHHNLTSAIASFRVAKALVSNPGSREGIDSFVWAGSAPFDWRAQQLLDLGLMEPGQWF